jgi:ribose-phosphate pyrophosphokinase
MSVLGSTNFIPVGEVGLIVLPGCEELAANIDGYLREWRKDDVAKYEASLANVRNYVKDDYRIHTEITRFGSGESKAVIYDTVRGHDLYILCDPFSHGITYKMYGKTVYMSPDDHYANLKRAISAIGGKARRITVIMPMLYEGRQHKRTRRESLDCATALQELCNYLGVENIITFDAHDARVQNAIPLNGFENVQPTYQMIKVLAHTVSDLKFDKEHLMIISPDEGGMSRGIYYSTVLGVELGMFYKRRDYSCLVDGRNPIIAHEFLGDNVEGKDVVVVDDMISSGDSMLEVSKKLKGLGAKRVFICACFGLFCNGFEKFDKAYEDGIFDCIYTTNLVYRMPELLERKWYHEVDLSKYISLIIYSLNLDRSISELLNPVDRINKLLRKLGYNKNTTEDSVLP